MLDYGWWFLFERKDGKPLPAWQFAFYMLVTPIINVVFIVVILLAAIALAVGSVVFFPFFYFKRAYQDYRKQFAAEQAETWKRISK